MKVYVVTTGEYSGYGIHAIFTKREVAETYIEQHTRPGQRSEFNEIEEYDAYDDLPVTLPVYVASTTVNRETGEAKPLSEWSRGEWFHRGEAPGEPEVTEATAPIHAPGWVHVTARGSNPDEVRKAVLDRLVRMAAEREGVAV